MPPAADAPILYSFRRCPYAMRARLALLVTGTHCVVREIALARKPAEMLLASPKATIPVLVLPDGAVIDESLDIMRWTLAQHDPEGWLDTGDDADELIAVNDGPFKQHLDRYKYPERHQSDAIAHREAGRGILAEWDDRLRGSTNLCGDKRSLADMAIMPFVRQFAQTDRVWFDGQPLQGLQRWLATHLASPLFEQAMIRLSPWVAGDPDIALGTAPSLESRSQNR